MVPKRQFNHPFSSNSKFDILLKSVYDIIVFKEALNIYLIYFKQGPQIIEHLDSMAQYFLKHFSKNCF